MNAEQAKALRMPFPPETIGKLPRGGTTLDYVGHAAVTDRLLSVDPEWTWEPLAYDPAGAPLITRNGKEASMWIKLTVCGVSRLGVGICAAGAFELEKQLVSDALRNAAMRFGVALDLWSRESLLDERAEVVEQVPDERAVLVDEVRARVEQLDPLTKADFVAWKSAQEFAWPWTESMCVAMLAKLDQLGDAGASDEDPF